MVAEEDARVAGDAVVVWIGLVTAEVGWFIVVRAWDVADDEVEDDEMAVVEVVR